MCGGFIGKLLSNDPIGGHFFKKTNPVDRAKRQAAEQMAEQTKQDAAEKNAALLQQTNDNQVLQADQVAMRRRKAAQSLLGRAGARTVPGSDEGQADMVQGRAYGQRRTAPELG